jgi:hypothetical protein
MALCLRSSKFNCSTDFFSFTLVWISETRQFVGLNGRQTGVSACRFPPLLAFPAPIVAHRPKRIVATRRE